jgi:hypothetical protein
VGFCGILWNFVELCGIVWSRVGFCGILWNFVELCGIVWNCGILWNLVESCGFVWNVLKMVKTRQSSNKQGGRGGLDLGGQQLLG